MLSLQTILDRISQHGWQIAEVEAAVRYWSLPPIDSWRESTWQMLESVL